MIELISTIAVIGVIASFALPAMLDLSPSVDAGPLEPLRALLLRARRDSEAGAVVEVSLVSTSGRYRIATRRPGHKPAVRIGMLALPGVRSLRQDDRFRVIFRPVGIGLGDSLVAGGVRLRVVDATGEVLVDR